MLNLSQYSANCATCLSKRQRLKMKVEALDKFWTDKSRYDVAEKRFYEGPQKVIKTVDIRNVCLV